MTGSPFDPIVTVTGINPYRYSPVAVWFMHPLAAVGPVGFVLLHFALLLTLPRRVGLIVALSFPFWVDMLWGNVFTLVFVTAWWAMRGNRAGVLTFLVLTLLMPRPVQLPLALGCSGASRGSGCRSSRCSPSMRASCSPPASARAGSRASSSRAAMRRRWHNFGPTRLFGYAWFVVGIPLALYLFRRHPAWAGLALSPYLLGQYWLVACLPLANGHEGGKVVDSRTGDRPEGEGEVGLRAGDPEAYLTAELR